MDIFSLRYIGDGKRLPGNADIPALGNVLHALRQNIVGALDKITVPRRKMDLPIALPFRLPDQPAGQRKDVHPDDIIADKGGVLIEIAAAIEADIREIENMVRHHRQSAAKARKPVIRQIHIGISV